MTPPARRSWLVLATLFFGSGLSSLVYQVLWLRLLALVFGVTVHAATTVLASFMAGLAIGSIVAGRGGDRTTAPLRWFGIVEIGIGVLALATQWLLPTIAPLLVAVHTWLPDGQLPLTFLRFTGSFLVLLAPTTLMGMTLPLMLKAAGAGAPDHGHRVGLLYAANTSGAVLGAVVTGFVLIGTFGIATSFALAAAVNGLVGAAALLLSGDEGTATTDSGPEHRGHTPRLPATAVAVFALSGFAALALEVVWFRILVYFVPATSYAFATMLGAVLLGLAFGSSSATPLLAKPDRLLRRLAGVHMATAIAVPLAATAIASAYRAGWHTTADIHISVVLALPPAWLMGMAYPLGLRLWAGTGDRATTRAGDLNSANLAGSIAGAVVGGFVALPWLGTRGGLIALAAVYLVTSILLLRALFPGRAVLGRAVPLILGFLATAVTVPDMLDVASGRRYPSDERPLWRQEGAQTTVAVRERGDGGRVLYLDGLHQASDAPDIVQLHRLIGHLPMALHPDPTRVLVVGLGGGVTPGAVSQHAAAVDVVELSPSVVAGARWFDHVNYAVTSRTNVHVRVDDGRHFLASRPQGTYDVVTADLIQPEHAGAGHLYSREYFALMRQALADGGVALQWIGHRRDSEYRLILRTFLEVFPHTTLWADGQLLVGSLAPLEIHRSGYARHVANAETRRALAAVGLDSFEALLRLFVAGPDALRTFVGDGPVLTDDRPLLEYFRSLPGRDDRLVDLAGVHSDVSGHVR